MSHVTFVTLEKTSYLAGTGVDTGLGGYNGQGQPSLGPSGTAFSSPCRPATVRATKAHLAPPWASAGCTPWAHEEANTASALSKWVDGVRIRGEFAWSVLRMVRCQPVGSWELAITYGHTQFITPGLSSSSGVSAVRGVVVYLCLKVSGCRWRIPLCA